jgi:hypothetical protein
VGSESSFQWRLRRNPCSAVTILVVVACFRLFPVIDHRRANTIRRGKVVTTDFERSRSEKPAIERKSTVLKLLGWNRNRHHFMKGTGIKEDNAVVGWLTP